MKVLMIAATGEFASLVLPELNKSGIRVRALVRDDEKAQKARALGASRRLSGTF